jgi:hypothetical protein
VLTEVDITAPATVFAGGPAAAHMGASRKCADGQGHLAEGSILDQVAQSLGSALERKESIEGRRDLLAGDQGQQHGMRLRLVRC